MFPIVADELWNNENRASCDHIEYYFPPTFSGLRISCLVPIYHILSKSLTKLVPQFPTIPNSSVHVDSSKLEVLIILIVLGQSSRESKSEQILNGKT